MKFKVGDLVVLKDEQVSFTLKPGKVYTVMAVHKSYFYPSVDGIDLELETNPIDGSWSANILELAKSHYLNAFENELQVGG